MDSLYFLHIPKTAGTSLRYWMCECFSEEDWLPCYTLEEVAQFSREKINQYRFFSGHFSNKLYDYLNHVPRTTTWLREPVAREISHFNFDRERYDELIGIAKTHGREDWINYWESTRKLSLPELCQSEYYFGYNDNLQVRHLSGAFPSDQLIECDSRMLDRAKTNLLDLFHFGICQQMEPSVDMLCYELGYPRRPITYALNASSSHTKSTNPYSADEIKIIRNANRFDVQLYEFARREFGRRLEQFWKRVDPRRGRQFNAEKILDEYSTTRSQQKLAEVLKQNFQQRHADTTTKVTDANIRFAENGFHTGWYPRSNENGCFVRWAGPSKTSSIFVPLAAHVSYRIRFIVRYLAYHDIAKSLRLRVGRRVIRLQSKKTRKENGNLEVVMLGKIPGKAINDRDPFTEIVFETDGTREQLVDYDCRRFVSFATDGVEISPLKKAA